MNYGSILPTRRNWRNKGDQMNARLPAILAQALAPMAPPQSEVHRIVSEAERREIMEIVDRHIDDARCGLDKTGHPWEPDPRSTTAAGE